MIQTVKSAGCAGAAWLLLAALPAAGRKRLEGDLEKFAKPALEELKKQREEARAALDTPKTYRAMRRRCD